ncbi:MAG: hypothetical protein RMI83_02475 [Desulfurococcaceae archaeon]|nr:hypothetical protein [Sulfolobales archaeon]MDW8169951.1 hypothetical protein [Desulfurococcaceae archaeon]
MLHLVSLPGVLIIGKYFSKGVAGVASMAVMNYRLVAVGNKGTYRALVNRIPPYLGGEIVEELFKSIYVNRVRPEDILSDLSISMYLKQVLVNIIYGGYVTSIMRSNRLDILDFEVVNESMEMYIGLGGLSNELSLDLSVLTLFGYAIREADLSLLKNILPQNEVRVGENWIAIPAWKNAVLVIAERGFSKSIALEKLGLKSLTRIKVDNVGLRESIKLEKAVSNLNKSLSF